MSFGIKAASIKLIYKHKIFPEINTHYSLFTTQMKRLFLSVALLCLLALQISCQQVKFKPQKQVTGPYGVASGTAFNFGMDTNSFNTLPNQMILSHGANGINSISFIYAQMIGLITKTAGTQSGAVTETTLGSKIVGAQVCTGTRSGATVIIGLKFTYENGVTNYFHGNNNQVTSLRCVDATPKTAGYYLQSLSGRYGANINQIKFYWVSDFSQEEACFNDPTCNQAVNYCPSDDCCYSKSKGADGQWEGSVACA